MATMTKIDFVRRGYDTADFDGLVQDAAEQAASRINNEGLSEQIEYLRSQGWSDDDILNALESSPEPD